MNFNKRLLMSAAFVTGSLLAASVLAQAPARAPVAAPPAAPAPAAAPAAAAAPTPAPVVIDVPETVTHPWVTLSPSRNPESYFSNLKDGETRESPLVVRFGLSMRGIVPAGKTAGRAGHHHLLVNQGLPLDFTKPLPATEHYIHFGKGQMEAVLNLAPGRYELRMLLADQGHIPFFVYSKPLILTISKQNAGVDLAKLPGPPGIELLSPADRSALRGPFRVQFHASGLNISHLGAQVPDTHHFRLSIERNGQKPEVFSFLAGQTEVWLNPPPGDYTLRLDLISNVGGAKVMAQAKPVSVKVAAR
jgi:hypothetical protein